MERCAEEGLEDRVREAFLKAGITTPVFPGDVVTIQDKAIKFPLNLLRKPHERRFCLILSNDLLCEQSPIILIAPMTHDTSIKRVSQEEIRPTAQNGLPLPSLVILEQIQPIEKASILQKIGKLSTDEWERVMAKILWNMDRA